MLRPGPKGGGREYKYCEPGSHHCGRPALAAGAPTYTVDTVNPLFDQLATKSDTSLKQVAENLKANAKAAEEFAEALNSSTSNAAYGTDEAYTQIVNTLAEQGPEATQLLKDFVAGAEEGSET